MMQLFESFEGKKVMILGFGQEGRSTYKLLRREFPNKKIYVADKNEKLPKRIGNDKNVEFFLGGNYLSQIRDFDIVVKSPGVSPTNEIVEAGKQGVEFTSQTKIFFEKQKGKIVGVTGTKGKSTTASLIHLMLKEAGHNTYLLGNIGKPALEVFKHGNGEKNIYVYELSSHQLYGMDKSPHVSVILNIGVDHLDWHGSQESYISAKKNVILHQKQGDLAILNYDDQLLKKYNELTKAKTLFFSQKKKVNGAFLDDSKMFIQGEKPSFVLDTKKVKLLGKHNIYNLMASVLVSNKFGVDKVDIQKVAYSFSGLEHRLEIVMKIKGVAFVNDSMSTNLVSLKAAVNSFTKPLTVIMGGYDRGLDYEETAKFLADKDNVEHVVLIGETADKLERELDEVHFDGKIYSMGEPDMKKLVKKSFEVTPKGGVVLLSPAAASFDMFENYKDRGKKFKKAVLGL